MEDAGQKLKKRREELNLRYRDVEEASLKIAARRQNDEYGIVVSRLADIENKGTLPTLYRLYSLCAIYRLDIMDVLEWYGIDLSMIPSDSLMIEVPRTHLVDFHTHGIGSLQIPLTLDPGIDLRRTTFLSRMIQRWGRLPLMLLNGVEMRDYRYAFVGTEDWMMYPIIHPGSLVLIDDNRRKIIDAGWAHEQERPIYLVEHRQGYALGWCTVTDVNDKGEGQLVVQPHPASRCPPEVFAYPQEVDVIGQVAGVAMRVDLARRRRTRGRG
ncbi:MAG: helix-turn-helix transcriptional regulator [Acidobacteria bacterium]|nr:helix-turn-helix transcriptional regulator [Acidobacteriota bacterium]MBI3282223.1 helix-turn-helix transcriptional regulator [Acidobacteriota bacterium]